jgi:hypothetical protein
MDITALSQEVSNTSPNKLTTEQYCAAHLATLCLAAEKEIRDGYERVNSTDNEEDEIFVNGILRGFLLDSGKFEIITEEGNPITGIIYPEIPEEQLIEYDKKYLNKKCRIHLLVHKTTFITGREKISYELVEITD